MPGKLRAPPEDEARTCGLTSSTVAYQKLPLNWTSREHPPEEGPPQMIPNVRERARFPRQWARRAAGATAMASPRTFGRPLPRSLLDVPTTLASSRPDLGRNRLNSSGYGGNRRARGVLR